MPPHGHLDPDERAFNHTTRLVTPINQHERGDGSDDIRVLHVDDERSFLELTAAFIDRVDDSVSIVPETSVEDGLARLEAEAFDCVISDYQMPGNDGLDFLDDVRRDHPNLPFVLFTGRGSEEIASEAIARGVTDYLQKGAGRDQYEVLVNRVRNAVEAHRTEEELWTTLSWYQRLVEQNLAGMYLIQEDEFVYVNERLADIFGYAQEELIGRSPTAVVDPGDHEELLENLRRREGGEVDSVRYTLRGERKDGSRVDFEAHGGVIQFRGTPAVMGLLLER